MTSPFIDDSCDFELTVFFTEKNGETIILPKKEDKCESITVKFRSPDFATSQQVLQACTRMTDQGIPSINYLQLQTSLLYALAKSWDAKDSDGKEMLIDNIGSLKVNIAKSLVEQLAVKVSSTGLF
jgi:hypothetical protein